MKILFYAVLIVLILLAASAGIAKIMLMPQEVASFAPFGLSGAILIAFGVVQVIGAVLLAMPKTRTLGAGVVGVTFLISAAILFMAGNIPMAIITVVFTLLLVFVIKMPVARRA